MADTLVWVTTPPCMFCSKSAQIELTETELAAVQSSMLIQDALPNRDAAFRELLVTGTHEHCWLSLMGSDEDEAE